MPLKETNVPLKEIHIFLKETCIPLKQTHIPLKETFKPSEEIHTPIKRLLHPQRPQNPLKEIHILLKETCTSLEETYVPSRETHTLPKNLKKNHSTKEARDERTKDLHIRKTYVLKNDLMSVFLICRSS